MNKGCLAALAALAMACGGPSALDGATSEGEMSTGGAVESGPRVRVLVLGSARLIESAGGTELARNLAKDQIARMNETFRAQGVPGELELAGFEEATIHEAGPDATSESCQLMLEYQHDRDYAETLYGPELVDEMKATMEDLAERRRRYEADLVVSVIDGPAIDPNVSAGCAVVRNTSGTSYPENVDNSYAFIDVKGFSSYTFLHEVGHLFGLEHRDDDFVAIPELEAGTLIMPKGKTISHRGREIVLQRIPVWSDRDFLYEGYSVAPASGEADVEVLRRTVGEVAKYYERWSAGEAVSVNP